MITINDKKEMVKILRKIDEYVEHFDEEFPIFEYIITPVEFGSYDKIKEVIDKAIKENKPVERPDDYDERTF